MTDTIKAVEQNEKHELLLTKVLALDRNVRFAAIANMKGELLARMVRSDLQTIMSLDETKKFMGWSAAAWNLRKEHHPKLGKELYNISVFEKLRRATLALDENRIMLIVIDNQGGLMQILDKLLNLILYKDPTHEYR